MGNSKSLLNLFKRNSKTKTVKQVPIFDYQMKDELLFNYDQNIVEGVKHNHPMMMGECPDYDPNFLKILKLENEMKSGAGDKNDKEKDEDFESDSLINYGISNYLQDKSSIKQRFIKTKFVLWGNKLINDKDNKKKMKEKQPKPNVVRVAYQLDARERIFFDISGGEIDELLEPFYGAKLLGTDLEKFQFNLEYFFNFIEGSIHWNNYIISLSGPTDTRFNVCSVTLSPPEIILNVKGIRSINVKQSNEKFSVFVNASKKAQFCQRNFTMMGKDCSLISYKEVDDDFFVISFTDGVLVKGV